MPNLRTMENLETPFSPLAFRKLQTWHDWYTYFYGVLRIRRDFNALTQRYRRKAKIACMHLFFLAAECTFSILSLAFKRTAPTHFHFSSMGSAERSASLEKYKEPFAGFSEKKFSRLLKYKRQLYAPFYADCLWFSRLGTCGPRLPSGEAIRNWKDTERAYKHDYYYFLLQHESDVDLDENRHKARFHAKKV